jgi:hypothetical protein
MKWKLLLLAGLAVTVPLFAYGTLDVTGARGYFSPDSLESRVQAESRLVWWGFHYYQYPLAEYLIKKGYWSPKLGEPRWIETYHWNYAWRGGQSRLHKEMGWRAEEWIDWSESNSLVAGAAWPRVLDALRSDDPNVRDEATSIMYAARNAKNAGDFERALKAEGLERWCQIGALPP